jgi:cytidylate kinase
MSSQACETELVHFAFDRVLTVDGASATGKTELLRGLYGKFGCRVVEVGVLFRTIAWLVHTNRITVAAAADFLERRARAGQLSLGYASRPHRVATSVVLGGRDLTAEVMEQVPDTLMPFVSRDPHAAAWVYQHVRHAIAGQPAAVSGRLAGLHVFPEAPLRLRLEAASSARRARKLRQIREWNQRATWLDDAALLGDVDGAMWVLDTTSISPELVLSTVASEVAGALRWRELPDRAARILAA